MGFFADFRYISLIWPGGAAVSEGEPRSAHFCVLIEPKKTGAHSSRAHSAAKSHYSSSHLFVSEWKMFTFVKIYI